MSQLVLSCLKDQRAGRRPAGRHSRHPILKKANTKAAIEMGENVIVIGGGNAAIELRPHSASDGRKKSYDTLQKEY